MASAPSLALPVFEDKDGRIFVQEIDDISGLISNLLPAKIPAEEIEPINGSVVIGLGDRPIYCLLQSHDTVEFGTLSKLEKSLNQIIGNEGAPAGLRVQAAELVGSSSQRRRTRNLLSNTIESQASAHAYRRSATRTFLWRRLIGAARDIEAAVEIKRKLSHLDVDIGRDGRVALRLENFDKNLCPSLDFSRLSAELEIELGFSTPSNDDEKPDQTPEQEEPLTPERLNWYMNRRFGSDGRIADHTYRYLYNVVTTLGFASTEQIERAIKGINSSKLCYISYGNLQGQATRFELSLLAALGHHYISRHPWAVSPWFRANQERLLQKMTSNDIPINTFDIEADQSGTNVDATTIIIPPAFELEP